MNIRLQQPSLAPSPTAAPPALQPGQGEASAWRHRVRPGCCPPSLPRPSAFPVFPALLLLRGSPGGGISTPRELRILQCLRVSTRSFSYTCLWYYGDHWAADLRRSCSCSRSSSSSRSQSRVRGTMSTPGTPTRHRSSSAPGRPGWGTKEPSRYPPIEAAAPVPLTTL